MASDRHQPLHTRLLTTVCVCVCVYITAYVHARRARDAGGPDPLTQTSESLPHAVLTLSKQ